MLELMKSMVYSLLFFLHIVLLQKTLIHNYNCMDYLLNRLAWFLKCQL